MISAIRCDGFPDSQNKHPERDGLTIVVNSGSPRPFLSR